MVINPKEMPYVDNYIDIVPRDGCCDRQTVIMIRDVLEYLRYPAWHDGSPTTRHTDPD
jgi:hypothetical protein